MKPEPDMPLFPDLIEQHDYQKRFADHLRTGHGVWSVSDMYRRERPDLCEEYRCVVIIYDNEKFHFRRDKTGKFWVVEINHYRSYSEIVTKGWGSSKTTCSKRRQRNKTTERKFFTRGEACAFAEKIIDILEAMKLKKEREEYQQSAGLPLSEDEADDDGEWTTEDLRKTTLGGHLVGDLVKTPDGIGKIYGLNKDNQTVEVGMPNKKGKQWRTKHYPLDQVVNGSCEKVIQG